MLRNRIDGKRTKIVATIGPTSRDEDTLRQMIRAGMNVARINFSHGDHETHGKTIDGVERLLYVTNKSGVSIYDINDSHKLLRSFEVPETADYKGISASVQLGKLYLTSNLKDDLVCIDLATESIDWRRHYADGYADSQAFTPDGKTLLLCGPVNTINTTLFENLEVSTLH